MNRKSRVVFFDIGHTLATGGDESPRRLLASRLGLSEKEAKRAGKLLMTHPATAPSLIIEALKRILPERDPEIIHREVEALWNEQMNSVRELDGSTGVLEHLRAGGARIGVLSNTWHPLYMGFQKACPGICRIVDFSLLSYRLGCKKPSPEIFREAVGLSGENADSCWMVGDSYEMDMAPALAAGMRTAWVLRRPQIEKSTLVAVLMGLKKRPDVVIEHLGELLEPLRE